MSTRAKTTGQLINGLVHLRQKAAGTQPTAIHGRSCNGISLRDDHSSPLPSAAMIDQVSKLGVDDMMEVILASAADLVHADHGFFYVYDADTDALELKRTLGCSGERIGYRLEHGAGLAGKVLRTGRAMGGKDYQSWGGRHRGRWWGRI